MDSLVKVSATPFFLQAIDRDLIEELLKDQRSPNTRRSYALTLKEFFRFITGGQEASPLLVEQFLALDYIEAFKLAIAFKASLIERGLKEATVNNRMSAIKSLVNFAQTAGKCQWNLNGIRAEKVTTYRDTAGVSLKEFKMLLGLPDRKTLKGKRDYALLRLFWENVLRRNEISSADVEDFQPELNRLAILGKGKGTQKETVELSEAAVEAIAHWLEARKQHQSFQPDSPLFIALDRVHFGHRLTGDGLYHLIRFQLAEKAEFNKQFSPHRCRHSGITALLNANNGNIRATQSVSRHADPKTLMRYDDNRKNLQGKGTNTLSELLDN